MANLVPRLAAAKNGLSVYRLLSPSASVRVSPICLGGMSFGEQLKTILGDVSKKTAMQIMDDYYEQGGNFIDTAGNYQSGVSEQWIGEWMKNRGNRDEIVLATKYTSPYNIHHGFDGPNNRIHVNTVGNSLKSLHLSVSASLEKLQTSYIDILYVHFWDFTTSIEEVMQGLNTLVQQGKVLYLGVSNTPAWIVAKANQYARDHGLRQFVVYQGNWGANARSIEREVVPMCAAEGMGITAYGTVGRGQFKTAEERKTATGRSARPVDADTQKVCDVLETISTRRNTTMPSVGMAYILHKTPYVFPICGTRSVEQLHGNIAALEVELSDEEVAEIDNAVPLDPGYPLSFIGGPELYQNPSKSWLVSIAGHMAYVTGQKPIKPSQMKIEKL